MEILTESYTQIQDVWAVKKLISVKNELSQFYSHEILLSL